MSRLDLEDDPVVRALRRRYLFAGSTRTHSALCPAEILVRVDLPSAKRHVDVGAVAFAGSVAASSDGAGVVVDAGRCGIGQASLIFGLFG